LKEKTYGDKRELHETLRPGWFGRYWPKHDQKEKASEVRSIDELRRSNVKSMERAKLDSLMNQAQLYFEHQRFEATIEVANEIQKLDTKGAFRQETSRLIEDSQKGIKRR